MDALLCFGMSLAVYTALVSGFTCLAIWWLLRQYSKALFGSFDFQPSCRPDTVYILPKRKVFHHRQCHHLARRDVLALAFQPCDNCRSLW